jgi:hypothetical protein
VRLPSPAFAAITVLLLLLGPRVQAQHLWWDLEGQKDPTCLYGTITVLATHRDIYYCGADWHPSEPAGGYCGIQHNNEKERRTIFSIWDTSPQLHPRVTEADPDAQTGRFGGEGEGAHTHLVWPWNVGEPVEFFLQKQKTADGNNTEARYYLYDRGTRRWRHISTILSPTGGQQSVETIAGGLNSFLENFSGKEKDVPKLALYRLWLGNAIDEMKPLTSAGGDGVWGQLNDSYFLAEGDGKKLDAVFRGLEKKYGKPVYGAEGKKLEPLTAKPVPAEVVKALKSLPRAEAIQLVSDVPRDDANEIIRSIVSRRSIAIGRDGKLYQSVGTMRVAWNLKQVGDQYQIVNAANGMVIDGSGDQPALKRASGAASQLWSFERAGDAYHIKCKDTGRALDLSGSVTEGAIPIIMWAAKEPPGDSNQLWMLTEVKKK